MEFQVAEMMKPTSSDGTIMQGTGHFVPNIQCGVNISSFGVVHVLRCADCGFETIMRERFVAHTPCASKQEQYSLYTCSQCGACSTSRVLMQEHGEFCHPNKTFSIEESVEEFKPALKGHLFQSKNRPSPPQDTRNTPSRFNVTPDALSTNRTPSNNTTGQREPCHHTSAHQISVKPEAFNSIKQINPLESSTHSSLPHFANHFSNSHGKQVLNQQLTQSEQSRLSADTQCSLCHQMAGSSMEDLAKHLALVHLLPLPSILTHLSVAMMAQAKIATSADPIGPGKSLPCTHTTGRTVDSLHWCPTQDYSVATSSLSRVHKQSLKRGHSPNDIDNRDLNFPTCVTETSPTPYPGLVCPQCSNGFPSIYQLQMHFVQEHSSELGSLLNLSTALTTGRVPFPIHPQLFYPFGVPFTQPSNLVPPLPNLYTRDSVTQPPSKCTQRILPNTDGLTFSDSSRTDSENQTIQGPPVPPINLMQLHLAAAAAALGFPYQPDLSTLSHDTIPTASDGNGTCGATVGSTSPDEIVSTNDVSLTYPDAKRSRMQTSSDNLDITTRTNGLMGNDGASSQWLNGVFANQVNKQSIFATKSNAKPPECIYQSVFKPELFAHPTATVAAATMVPPNFSPVSGNFSIFPSPYASLHRTASQLDPNLANCGSGPEDALNTNRSNLQSSPVNAHMGPTVSKLAKSDAFHCVQAAEPDHLGNHPCKPYKSTPFGQNVIKSVSESISAPLNVDLQGNTANGIVHNTLRKTRSDMKVIHRYLMQVKHDTRDIHLIPHYELDQYIQDFVLTAKKKDGHEYEPESLKAFVHSLERHLKHHDYPHSVLKGNAFAGTRTVLNQRLSELRALSRSGSSTMSTLNSCTAGAKRPTEQPSVESASLSYGTKRSLVGRTFTPAGLMQAGLLGKDNPQAILNSLWLMNRTQFNIGGTQRHRNLVWGQFQLVTDETGTKAIKFTPLFESAEVRYCRGYGGIKGCSSDVTGRSAGSMQALSCTGTAKRQPLPFNCVELFEIYGSHRPPDACGVSEPFYLCPEPLWEQNGNWFKTNAAGSQLLARIPRLLGLKPTREPVQSSASAVGDFSQLHKGPYEIIQHTVNSAKYDSSSPGNGQSLYPIFGGQMFEKQSVQIQNQTRYTFPTSCSPLAQSFFNFFPLMFPPGSDPVPMSTTSQFPCLPPPNTAYSDVMSTDAGSLLPVNAEKDHEAQGLIQNRPIRSEKHEADELNQSDRQHSSEQAFSPERYKRSPGQQSGCDAVAVSSNGTISPTDAENLSLSGTSPRVTGSALDITQPNQPTSRLRTDTGGIMGGPNSKEAYSPQHSSDSHSSRPHSGASRFSLVESSESLSQNENHVDAGPAHTLEQRTEPNLPNEALNLTSSKLEKSKY
ncbi:unnamed protein product, partial [Dicrocoelium dendriticum]